MMSRVRLGSPLAVALLGLVLVLPGTLSTATTSGPAAVVPVSGVPRTTVVSTLESDVLKAVNGRRVRAGCRPLQLNAALRTSARRHSITMARRGVLSHRVSGESTLQARIRAAGYTGATMVGEVIASGARSSDTVVAMWMQSSLHRKILLNCRFVHVGAGVVRSSTGRPWWTIDLARR